MGDVLAKTRHATPAGHSLLRQAAFVGGRWMLGNSDSRIPVTNPADGSLVGTVPSLTVADTDLAIDGARRALPLWRALRPRERGDLLTAWHDLILGHADQLAALMTAEQGKPLADARGEIAYGASFVQWFAEEASRTYGDVIPSHLPDRKMFVQKEPLGVVALVTPWNFPSAMLTRKAAAALAAGCTAIAVPSLETPFSALALAALADEAGVPPGVLSVLTGDPATLVGRLCESEVVRGLSFTGSTAVGRLLLAQCAPTVKRVSLELGGHAPFIAFPDCDIEEAAAAAVGAKFQTSGQDCLAANRIYVHESIKEDFVAAFVRLTEKLKVGPGLESGTELGPLINQRTLEKSLEHIADAVQHGARLVAGGERHPSGDLFLAPTVLVDVTPEMKIASEETFGPVAGILSFANEEAVIRAANATEYGLVAYVFTRDIARAMRMTDALEYGMVGVNTIKLTGAPIPFGGVKQSGLGREGSLHGIDEYLEQKYVCIGI